MTSHDILTFSGLVIGGISTIVGAAATLHKERSKKGKDPETESECGSGKSVSYIVAVSSFGLAIAAFVVSITSELVQQRGKTQAALVQAKYNRDVLEGLKQQGLDQQQLLRDAQQSLTEIKRVQGRFQSIRWWTYRISVPVKDQRLVAYTSNVFEKLVQTNAVNFEEDLKKQRKLDWVSWVSDTNGITRARGFGLAIDHEWAPKGLKHSFADALFRNISVMVEVFSKEHPRFVRATGYNRNVKPVLSAYPQVHNSRSITFWREGYAEIDSDSAVATSWNAEPQMSSIYDLVGCQVAVSIVLAGQDIMPQIEGTGIYSIVDKATFETVHLVINGVSFRLGDANRIYAGPSPAGDHTHIYQFPATEKELLELTKF